jgi:DNA-binding CsgD family transcriptional regulator
MQTASELSEMERRVIDLTVQGIPVKKMASMLFIAPSTVNRWKHRAMEKIGAKLDADVVRWYVITESKNGKFDVECFTNQRGDRK